MVAEARLKDYGSGLAPATDGWFVVNAREAAWLTHDVFGASCMFESPDAEFTELGIRLSILEPGQPNGLYHGEETQEDFLVLSGECLLIVEDEERRLKAWDFFHCAPGTHHILVGAGNGPCAILMVGLRGEGKKLHYPVSEVALRHGASTPVETDTPSEAYRDWSGEYKPVRATWPL